MPSSSAALSRRHHPNLELDQQLCFALYSATHAMTGSYRRALAAVGLTYPQYLVMLVLWEGDGARISDIAGALDLDGATVTPLVQRLEAGGWVKRLRVPGDDRMVSVTLQPQGWAIQARVAEIQKAMACRTGLQPAEFDRLKAALLEMAGRMTQALDTVACPIALARNMAMGFRSVPTCFALQPQNMPGEETKAHSGSAPGLVRSPTATTPWAAAYGTRARNRALTPSSPTAEPSSQIWRGGYGSAESGRSRISAHGQRDPVARAEA